MKKINIYLMAGVSLLASCSQKQFTEATLTGTTDLADGEILCVGFMDGKTQQIDTIEVNGGKFSYSRPVEKAMRVTLFNGELAMNNKKMRSLFLEPGEVSVILTGGDYSEAPVEGSEVTRQMDEIEGIVKSKYAYCQSLNDSLMAYQDDIDKSKEFKVAFDSIRQEIPSIYKNWIIDHPTAIYGAFIADMLIQDMSLDELKEMYAVWTPEVQSYAENTKAEIDILEAIQPGNPAPDIVALNQNGEEVKLSSLKGNVVLLDFWATWCGPCRASFPHINSLYEKYKDKGFKIFMVADDDSNPAKWKEFILKDDVNEYYHVLRGLKVEQDKDGKFIGYDKSQDNSEKYAVHYLPTKFLIDAEGNIIGKVSDEELDTKLIEIYGE